MRIAIVNLVFDRNAGDPQSLVDRYPSLTGFAEALARAGVETRVVQRSPDFDCRKTSPAGVEYSFVTDDESAFPATSFEGAAVVEDVFLSAADIVHVNGLMFPAVVDALRDKLPPSTPIVVQDHAGTRPPGAIGRTLNPSWRGLAEADAYSFTATANATPWREAGLLNRTAPIFEIVEAGTALWPVPRGEARARTQLSGDPLLLWVGRLNQNKDPLTVLGGVARVFEQMPDAELCMVYNDATLEADVRRVIDRWPQLRERVTLTWRVPHDSMPLYYSSSDFYVSGSHQEGSGYALIEAMACGVIPIVTDIPPFRVIAGDCGVRWSPGDAASLADALVAAARLDREREVARVREHFERELTWDAIAAKTIAAYRTLLG